ncbi:thiamine phosphate synthase [Chitinophaga sancti]|uniref:thiamine phosphate synthase n=1 Tax=Chitinophaga sancti TaxID=1004 RepID=UPI003F7AC57F
MMTIQYISQQTGTCSHLDNIRMACAAGCKWIQLRMKHADTQAITATARLAKEICDAHGATLIINDHPGIAALVDAHGTHVGKEDMTVAQARRIAGPHKIVGGTANTLEDILRHAADGADYVGIGPYRFTTTKEKLSPILGLDGIRNIMSQLRVKIPVIAIGGITAEDVPGLFSTGIQGIALSGLITHAPDKRQLISSLYQTIAHAITSNS